MKVVLAVCVLVALVCLCQGQGDAFRRMAMMQMLRGGGGARGLAGAGGAAAGGSPLTSMLGGQRGLGLMMAGGMGGDRLTDLLLCNMMPANMKQMCQLAALQ